MLKVSTPLHLAHSLMSELHTLRSKKLTRYLNSKDEFHPGIHHHVAMLVQRMVQRKAVPLLRTLHLRHTKIQHLSNLATTLATPISICTLTQKAQRYWMVIGRRQPAPRRGAQLIVCLYTSPAQDFRKAAPMVSPRSRRNQYERSNGSR